MINHLKKFDKFDPSIWRENVYYKEPVEKVIKYYNKLLKDLFEKNGVKTV